jgi:hypothetical protein
MGDRFLLPLEFSEESEQAVTDAFGHDFARQLFALKPKAWSGPVASGYGIHLVRVSALRPREMRPFPEVRAQLLEEWRYEQEKSAKERYLAELRRKFDVVVGDDVKVAARASNNDRAGAMKWVSSRSSLVLRSSRVRRERCNSSSVLRPVRTDDFIGTRSSSGLS